MPCFHTEHWPSSFWPRVARPGKLVLEGRFADAVLDELLARGHLRRARRGLDRRPPVRRAAAKRTARCYAGANPRGMQGYAVGR